MEYGVLKGRRRDGGGVCKSCVLSGGIAGVHHNYRGARSETNPPPPPSRRESMHDHQRRQHIQKAKSNNLLLLAIGMVCQTHREPHCPSSTAQLTSKPPLLLSITSRQLVASQPRSLCDGGFKDQASSARLASAVFSNGV
ncbi:predicted protein [Histoplasma capsulatum G186AR]|uniref:Uncharacterized protein n=1 Tax=Ajellomyces capsulatus (strain G186AR / H82 / ATCC MYA-2454 / RMSCC 2432) TaxID=447093 RepID=C0NRD3_AJECG|nr:uncharacterized protein HCBG_05563 [Histoplasma capsulatum G186AR]EEH06247.1 predicted protein [Histoplasma capsulatum G186AR]